MLKISQRITKTDGICRCCLSSLVVPQTIVLNPQVARAVILAGGHELVVTKKTKYSSKKAIDQFRVW